MVAVKQVERDRKAFLDITRHTLRGRHWVGCEMMKAMVYGSVEVGIGLKGG